MSDRQAGHWLGWDERWYPGTPPPGWREAPDGRWHPPEGSDVDAAAGGVPDAPYRPTTRTGAPGRTFRHPAYVDLPPTGARMGVANDGGRARAYLPDPQGPGGRDDDEAFQVPAYLDAPTTGRPDRDVRAQDARGGPYLPGPPVAGDDDLPGGAHLLNPSDTGLHEDEGGAYVPHPPDAGGYPSGDLHDGGGAGPGRFDSFFDPTDEDVPQRGRDAGEGPDQDGGTRPYDGWTYGAGDAGLTDTDDDDDRDGPALDPTLTTDDPDATAAYDAKHLTGAPGHHPNELPDATAAYGAKHLFDTDGSNADADDPFAPTSTGHDDDPFAAASTGHAGADRFAAASDHDRIGDAAGPDDHERFRSAADADGYDPFAPTATGHDNQRRFGVASDLDEQQRSGAASDADRFGAASDLDEQQWFGTDAGPDDHDPFAATMVVHDDAGRGWSGGGGGDSPPSRPPAPWQVSVAATRRSRMAAEDDARADDGGDFLAGFRAWPAWARVAMPVVVLVLLLAMVVAGFLLPGDDQTATTDGTTTLPTSGGVTVTGATSTPTTAEATGTTEAPATTESPSTTAEATTTTRPRGPSTTGTTATPTTVSESGCHSSYSSCVPADASDVDCTGRGDGPVWVDGPIEVTGPDVFDLDRNHDGTACE